MGTETDRLAITRWLALNVLQQTRRGLMSSLLVTPPSWVTWLKIAWDTGGTMVALHITAPSTSSALAAILGRTLKDLNKVGCRVEVTQSNKCSVPLSLVLLHSSSGPRGSRRLRKNTTSQS